MSTKTLVPFLDNPPHRAKRAHAKKHAGARKRGKRPPPAGFRTWKAFMQSIRPGAKKRRSARKRARQATSTGSTAMAKSKKHRRRHAVAKNPPRHHRRRRHHNPPMRGLVKGIIPFALGAAVGGAVGVGGKIVVRKVRGSVLKMQPATVIGSLAEAALAIGIGFAISKFHRGAGAAFAQGGIMAPIESEVQNLGIPHISDSLGDDGYLVGPGTGVSLVSAYPDDYTAMLGAEDLGRYVAGSISRPPMGATPGAMGAYVAGAA